MQKAKRRALGEAKSMIRSCGEPLYYSDPQIDRNGFQHISSGDILLFRGWETHYSKLQRAVSR